MILNHVAQVLLYAVVVWLMYIALEPIARRRWPHLLVGWSRLLAGRLRDPLVGRDLLIGGLGGIALALVVHLAIVVPGWLGVAPAAPRGQIITSLGDIRHLLYFVFWSPYAAATIGFGTLFGLFMFRAILRNQWLALALLAIYLYFGFALFTGIDELWSVAAALFAAVFLVIALRAGLLSAVVCFYVYQILEATPMTANVGAWYFDRTLLTVGVVGALLVYGFWTSLAGRSPFGRVFLEND